MRILALDSSGNACSAALWADGAVRARRFELGQRGHAERLLPMLLEVTAEAGGSLATVDLFAATIGPGAFTGLRIGLAALRGLALAADRPMLGVTSLEAVAHATLPAERAGRTLLVLLESRRAELYAQSFTSGLAPAGKPVALLPGVLAPSLAGAPLLLAGDGVARALPALRAARCLFSEASSPALPDAAVVAALAAARATEARRTPPAPLYLRPPDVTLTGKSR